MSKDHFKSIEFNTPSCMTYMELVGNKGSTLYRVILGCREGTLDGVFSPISELVNLCNLSPGLHEARMPFRRLQPLPCTILAKHVRLGSRCLGGRAHAAQMRSLCSIPVNKGHDRRRTSLNSGQFCSAGPAELFLKLYMRDAYKGFDHGNRDSTL